MPCCSSEGYDICDILFEDIYANYEYYWNGLDSLKEVLNPNDFLDLKSHFKSVVGYDLERVPAEWKCSTGKQGLNSISFKDFVELDINRPEKWLDP